MNDKHKLRNCKSAVFALWIASVIVSYGCFFRMLPYGGDINIGHWLCFTVFFVLFLAVASFCMGKIGYILFQIVFAIPIISIIFINVLDISLTDTIAGFCLAGFYLVVITPFMPVYLTLDSLDNESGLLSIVLFFAIDLIISLVYFLKPIKEKHILWLIGRCENINKKYYVATGVIVLTIIAGFTIHSVINSDVKVIVNNDKIYRQQINTLQKSQKVITKIKQEQGIQIDVEHLSYNERLDKCIRDQVILQQAERDDVLADYDECYRYQKEQLENIIKNGGKDAEFISQYREMMGFTLDQYLEQATISWQISTTNGNLCTKYFEDNPDATEQDYEKYIFSLVEKSNIKYK